VLLFWHSWGGRKNVESRTASQNAYAAFERHHKQQKLPRAVSLSSTRAINHERQLRRQRSSRLNQHRRSTSIYSSSCSYSSSSRLKETAPTRGPHIWHCPAREEGRDYPARTVLGLGDIAYLPHYYTYLKELEAELCPLIDYLTPPPVVPNDERSQLQQQRGGGASTSSDRSLENYSERAHGGSNQSDTAAHAAVEETIAAGFRDLQPQHRSMLVDWLVEVTDVFDMSLRSVFLAVNYTDRYLSAAKVSECVLLLTWSHPCAMKIGRSNADLFYLSIYLSIYLSVCHFYIQFQSTFPLMGKRSNN
jgi:hypothetical protein